MITDYLEIACDHYLETWQVIVANVCRIPIGGFLLLSQLNTLYPQKAPIGLKTLW